jgi:hypothetical protein
VRREDLRQAAVIAGLADRLSIPQDGETIAIASMRAAAC